jgi:hypothetical protein
MVAQGRHLRRDGGSEAAPFTVASEPDVMPLSVDRTSAPLPGEEATKRTQALPIRKKMRPGGDDRACSRA